MTPEHSVPRRPRKPPVSGPHRGPAMRRQPVKAPMPHLRARVACDLQLLPPRSVSVPAIFWQKGVGTFNARVPSRAIRRASGEHREARGIPSATLLWQANKTGRAHRATLRLPGGPSPLRPLPAPS